MTRNDANKTFLEASTRTSTMLEQMLNGYDKRLRPNFAGSPSEIKISMHVLSLVPIREIDMEARAVIFFREHWTDPRLAYGPSLGIPKMKLLGNIVDQVWLPDTYFVNDLSDTKSNEDFLFELTEKGRITYSYRRTLRLYCPMNLQKFPMDEQICEMAFESYSYAVEDIILTWLNPDALQIDGKLQIPQYTLVAWQQKHDLNKYSTGNFTSLAAVLHFKRQLAAYFLQEFIPTILIVAISWVSFWIDKRSVPARVSLGITTVLALTTLMFGIQTSMPRVGHVKAIDVFLLCSFFFVFSALIEYAIICTLSNAHSSRADGSLKQHSHVKVIPSEILDENKNGKIAGDKNETPIQDLARKQGEIQRRDHSENHYSSRYFPPCFSRKRSSGVTKGDSWLSLNQRQPCDIDRHCRKLFPMAYALFLSIYFVVYYFADI
ncbi:hypothetical protein ABFA07_007032 [Porites harrisoni]